MLGRDEEANRMLRDVYAGRLKLNGDEHEYTFIAADNYALSLLGLQRFEEAKALLRKMMPVARRVLGESYETTLKMRTVYARALFLDAGATLEDLREAVTTLGDVVRIARRVFGGEHPLTMALGEDLQDARAALRARETPPGSA